jgi:hypothetical protein
VVADLAHGGGGTNQIRVLVVSGAADEEGCSRPVLDGAQPV